MLDQEPLLGAGALTVLPELLTVFHDFEMVIFGAILMAVMIFLMILALSGMTAPTAFSTALTELWE